MNDNRTILYNALKNEGYTDIGENQEEFNKLLEKPENVRVAYDAMRNSGYTDIGDSYEEFAAMLVPNVEQKTTAPVPAQETKGGENGFTLTAGELGLKEEAVEEPKNEEPKKEDPKKTAPNRVYSLRNIGSGLPAVKSTDFSAMVKQGATTDAALKRYMKQNEEFNLTDGDREQMAQRLREKTDSLMSNPQNASPNLDYGSYAESPNVEGGELEVSAEELEKAQQKTNQQMVEGMTTEAAINRYMDAGRENPGLVLAEGVVGGLLGEYSKERASRKQQVEKDVERNADVTRVAANPYSYSVDPYNQAAFKSGATKLRNADDLKMMEEFAADAKNRLLTDEALRNEAQADAELLGMSLDDYINKIAVPVLQQRMYEEWLAPQEEKAKGYYNGVIAAAEGSLIGMLLGSTRTETEKYLSQVGQEAWRQDASLLDRALSGAGSMFLDLPIFGGFGSLASVPTKYVGGQVFKHLAKNEAKKVIARGASEAAAQRYANYAVTNGLKNRILLNLSTSPLQSGLTFGMFDAGKAALNMSLNGEWDWSELGKSAGGGFLLGAALGGTNAVGGGVTAGLTGGVKTAAKIAEFGVENAVFTEGGRLIGKLHGQQPENGWWEDYLESGATLLMLKAPNIVKNVSAIKGDKEASEVFAFNKLEREQLGKYGEDLNAVLESLLPQSKRVFEDGLKINEGTFTEEYRRVMSDPEVSMTTKAKLMGIVEGKVMPAPRVVDAQIEGNRVMTYDPMGRLVEVKEYATEAKANAEYKKVANAAEIESIAVLEDVYMRIKGYEADELTVKEWLAKNPKVTMERVAEIVAKNSAGEKLTDAEQKILESLRQARREGLNDVRHLNDVLAGLDVDAKDVMSGLDKPIDKRTERENRAVRAYTDVLFREVKDKIQEPYRRGEAQRAADDVWRAANNVKWANEDVKLLADRIYESDRQIDETANDGMIYTTTNNKGEKIIITGGKVVLDNEGYIDVNQSEGLVALMPDGTKKPVRVDELREKVEVANAEEIKAVKREEIANELADVIETESEWWESLPTDNGEVKTESGKPMAEPMADASQNGKLVPGAEIEIAFDGEVYKLKVEGRDERGDIILSGKGASMAVPESAVLEGMKEAERFRSGEVKGENQIEVAPFATTATTEMQTAPVVEGQKTNTAPVAQTETAQPQVVAPKVAEVTDFFRMDGKNYAVVSRNEDGSVTVDVDGKRAVLPAETNFTAAVPTDKGGKVLFTEMPAEKTLEYFVQRVPNSQARAQMIENNRKQAESALKKYDKEPNVGTDPDAYEATMNKWEADKKAAQAKVDYWNEVAKRDAEISQSEMRESVEAVKPREVVEMTPDEFVANQLGGIKITPESFQKETGTKAEQKQMVGVIAGKEKGGVSIERAAEIIYESYGDELRGLGFNGDMQDVRDMIIDVLSNGNPRSFARKGLEMRQQADVEQQLAELRGVANALNFESIEEQIAYEESIVPRIMQELKGFDETEYFNNLAENYENDTTRESENTRGSSELLQSKQSADNAGVADLAEPGQGGEVQGDVYSGGKNAAPQGNQQVNGSEILSTGDTTSPVEANAEGGNAPGQSGVSASLVKGTKWENTGEPDKIKFSRKKGDSHDITWYIGKKKYGSTTAERDLLVILAEDYGGDLNAVWNAYEQGEVLLSANEAAILKKLIETNTSAAELQQGVLELDRENPAFERATKVTMDAVERLKENGLDIEVVSEEEANAMMELADGAEQMTVFHGSGAKFDRFDHSYMGTGEGNQAFGWGTYVTEVEGIGKQYAEAQAMPHLRIPQMAVYDDLSRYDGDFYSAKQNLLDYYNSVLEKYPDNYTIATRKNLLEDITETDYKKSHIFKSRNLYSVEIPDDNGSNYLHWDKPINRRVIDRIIKSLPKGIDVKFWVPNYLANASNSEKALWWMNEYYKRKPRSGEAFYNLLSATLGSDKAASEFLNNFGFVGISYPAEAMTGGRADGARNYVIFNENDAQIKDRVEFFEKNGKVYGWAVNGTIYLMPDGINPNTPVHEYAHLWGADVEKNNPKLWNEVVEAMKLSPVWNEVANDANYSNIHGNDSRMASEVLSRLSGRENYRRTMEEAEKEIAAERDIMGRVQKKGILNRIKNALKNFWNWVQRNVFKRGERSNIKAESESASEVMPWEEFANSVIGDFYKGKNPNVKEGPLEKMFMGEKGAENLDKAKEATTRLDNLGVAREMETAGKDAKAIKLATGWERGADGKWRYETEDVKLNRAAELFSLENHESYPIAESLDKGRVDFNGTIKLADLVNDEELFKAYPGMEKYFVSFEEMSANVKGEHDAENTMIRINKDDISELESTLVHEIQHAIQSAEGFAMGGSTETIDVIKDKARVWAWRNALKETEKEHPELAGTTELEKVLMDEYRTEGLEEYIPTEEQRIKGFNLYARGYDGEGYERAFYAMPNVVAGNGFATYRRLAGEVESRNVEERMNYTEEQRRNSLAEETEDVSRKDQIFLEDALKSAMMGSRVDARMAEVASHFDGKELSAEQRVVADVFGGKADNLTISVKTQDGNTRNVEMRQGNDLAGAKHSLYAHYGTTKGVINADDLLLIPDVIANGERTENGKKAVYKLDVNGTKYTVVTYVKQNKEEFHNFYSNKKGQPSQSVNASIGDTHSARITEELASADKGNTSPAEMQEGETLFSKKELTPEQKKESAEKSAVKNNANFVSTYKTKDGKDIEYTSERAEGYGIQGGGTGNSYDGTGNSILQRQTDTGVPGANSGLNEDKGEFCVVERVFTENGAFNFTSGEKIESADDVAYIFSALEDAAKEHSFVVYVKDGKPTVVELGMGSFNATMVDIPTASLAYSRINPDHVYFVHNHPSGNLICSDLDVKMLREFEGISDVPVTGVIINLKTGKYGTFDTERHSAIGEKRVPENEERLTVHTLDKQIFAPDYDPMAQPLVRSSQDVAQFLNSQRMGDRPKVSFLILSRANRIIGNIHTPFTDITTDTEAVARYINERVIQFGGENAILYGDFAISMDESRGFRLLQGAMERFGKTKLLDVVHVEGNFTKSAIDLGLLYEPEMEYNVAKENEERYNSPEQDIPLDEVKSQPLTFAEKITNSVLEASAKNKENLALRSDALRMYGRDVANVLKLMGKQREYDKSTVDQLVKLAKMYFKDAQLLGGLTPHQVGRVMTRLNNAVGKRDITDDANELVNILVDAHNKELDKMLEKQAKTKAKKVNASGVEVIGKLDKEGQLLLEEYNNSKVLDLETIDEKILDLQNEAAEASGKLEGENGEVEREVAAKIRGLELARQYREEILAKQTEIKGLEQELKTAEQDAKEGAMDRAAYKEFRRATERAILESKLEMVDVYHGLIHGLGGDISSSAKRAKLFQQQQIDHVKEIQHNANSDLSGHPAEAQGETPDKWNSSVPRFFMVAMPTFQTMLKFFGEKAADGRGYLYERFIPQHTQASHNEYIGKTEAREKMRKKLTEIFGKKISIEKFMDMSRKDGAVLEYQEGGQKKMIDLTKGQVLYLYMINKMADGQMKLSRMGITDADVLKMARELPEEMVRFADWVQEEFLTELREKYNKVHERMFGAPMAAIESYFPIKINKRSRGEKIEPGMNAEDKPSTVTGSVIKRTKNAVAIDLSADAMQVLLGHIDDMENWAAWAEFRRDVKSLLNYRHFQNQVKGMESLRYGSGEKLWKNFVDVANIAAGSFKPSSTAADRAVRNIAKGVVSSKIAFRYFTALKQILSTPAFWSEVDFGKMINAYLHQKKAWDWAMKNLPGFSKRWEGRASGNEVLLESDADWKVWQNRAVQWLSKEGMRANAFIDALTVATGAKAVFETKYEMFKKAGYSEERAREKALNRAAEAYNESQQSSESAYLSPLQAEATFVSSVLTAYRNSPFGYNRKMATAIANLKKKMKKGFKQESIEYMTKQLMRDGLNEEQAKKFAKSTYRRSVARDAADVALYEFFLNYVWVLGPSLIYILGGDDDEKKKELNVEALIDGAMGGLGNLPAGETLTGAIKAIAEGDVSNFKLPQAVAMQDMETIADLMQTDPVRAAGEVLNILVAMGVGVNPQTFTDMFVALADTEEWSDPREIAMLVLRLINAPNSKLELLEADEAIENYGANMEEVMKEYAEYQKSKRAPLTGWMYSDESEQKAIERYEKRFKKYLDERLESIVENTDEYDAWYDNSDVLIKAKLAKLRKAYLEGDKNVTFEKLEAEELVKKVLYGSGYDEVNTVYYGLSTAEDEDMSLMIDQKLKDLKPIDNEYKRLTGDEKKEYAKRNSNELRLYDKLNGYKNDVDKCKRDMKKRPDKAQERMDLIRKLRTKAIDLINNYNE